MPYVWLATNCAERGSLHEYHTQSIPHGVSCIQLSHSKHVHDVSSLPLRSWVMGVPVASRIQNPMMVMAQVFEQTRMMGLSACGMWLWCDHNAHPKTQARTRLFPFKTSVCCCCVSQDLLTNTFTRFGEVLNRTQSLVGLWHSLLNTVSFVLGSCIKPTLRRYGELLNGPVPACEGFPMGFRRWSVTPAGQFTYASSRDARVG
jgi:hypothetical protein